MHEEQESVKHSNHPPNKVNPFTTNKCEQAVRLLEKRIENIPDVQSWAKEVGVSRRWLCKSMKAVYGKPPKIILREMKYEKVVWLIRKYGLDASCYCVAVDAGFRESKKVSMFLSSFYHTNFTELKMELLQEEVQRDFFMVKW